MSAPEYPIGTITEMAAIPEEAMPRFLAELPAILGEVRRMTDVMALFNEAFGDVAQMRVANIPATWIDDDKGIGTISVAMPDGEKLTVERHIGGDA